MVLKVDQQNIRRIRIKTKKTVFFICVFLLTISSVQSMIVDNNLYNIKNFKSKSIPGINNINDLIQDRNGLIWLATFNGIYIYTGHKFVKYPLLNENGKQIDKKVFSLLEDRDGIVWAGTENSLLKINQTENKVQIIDLPASKTKNKNNFFVNSISQGNLICVSTDKNGLFIYNSKKKWVKIPLKKDGKSIDNINTVKYTGDNVYYVGTKDSGLFRLTINSEIQGNHSYEHISDLKERSVTSIVKSETDKKLYMGTEHGLYTLDQHTDLIEFVKYRKTLINIDINSIYIENNILWIASPGSLINIDLLKKDGTYVPKISPLGLGGSNINRMLKDREGNYWLASSLYGLFRFNKFNKNIRRFLTNIPGNTQQDNISIWDIKEADPEHFWVGTYKHGLVKLDKKTKSIKNYILKIDKGSKIQNRHINKLYLSKDKIWAGIWNGGVFKFDPLKKNFNHIIDSSNGLLSDHVLCFNETENGDILIGTVAGGLQILRTNKPLKTDLIYFKNEKYRSFNAAIIKKDIVNKEMFWIGTFSNGLLKYESNKNELTKCSSLRDIKNTPSIRIHYIHQSENDPNLIFTGLANGVVLYDIKNNKWERFSKKKIMDQCTAVGIKEDKKGDLWISTLMGLLKYDLKKDKVFIYSELNKAVGTEFNEGSCLKISDGSLMFGGTNGIVSFKPDKVRGNNYINKIRFIYYIDNLNLNLINKSNKDQLRFKKGQKITLGFSAVSMIESEKNIYMYNISPIDKKWNRIKTNGIIHISDLKPGNYDLSVKGANNDGVWTKDQNSLKFEVSSENSNLLFIIVLSALLLLSFISIFLLRKIKTQKTEKKISLINDMDNFLKNNGITTREQEVLKLWIDGKSREEIEEILFISYHTVKNHIQNIYKKLNVSNRGELLLKVKYDVSKVP